MKRVLLICLSLVLALVGGSAACAADGFYVIGGGKSASVPKTGQTTSYGARDDGALQKGVAWPTPRFTDNNNGTVTDNLTKLIWTKNANAFGAKNWPNALTAANTLASGSAGLTDGSTVGVWRLPNIRELQSLINYGFYGPALPNTLGTGQWEEGNPFQGVQPFNYWSSNTHPYNAPDAFHVNFCCGSVYYDHKSTSNYVWCVRAGP
ncbi:MAG: DUF1566 domain-containing protein [Deltaproteobacteria bacterium]|nr:DUF1566 domain-containing protein [Deltaproteobacteria bacterium]